MDAANFAGSTTTTVKPPNPHDFHKTPPEPTEALIRHYRTHLEGMKFHDGSCGDGAITRKLSEHGFHFMATDLIDRGFGLPGVDFLTINPETYSKGQWSTIQNPPFKYWSEFVEQCHALEMPFIAMFGKQQVWNVIKRLDLYKKFPPKAVHPLTWRVDFSGQKKPIMDCCWTVWGENIPYSNEPLRRPT